MKNRKIQIFIVLFVLPLFCISGISFRDLNLSGDDRLLFRADFEGRHAIFLSMLADMSMRQLTAFPEKLQLIDNGRTILVSNHFGVSMLPVSGGLPSPLTGYPSFSQGHVPLKGRLQEFAVSDDGKWVLYIEPTSPAYGNLILIDISNSKKWVVSEMVELPASDFPARWSADSRLFVYSKSGRLFYFPIISDLSTLIDERFRMIGAGEITSVLWGQNGEFYYFLGNTLYRVINPELFTRTIYGDFLSIGSVAAILPVDFDSGFDRYWIAPDSGAILINKKGKSFSIFLLGESQNSMGVLPYITIPQGEGNFNVFWPSSGPLTITSSVQNEINVWRYAIGERSIRTQATENTPISAAGLISPDGTRAVFWGEGGLELWDYTNWRLIQKVISEPVYSCVWNGSRQLICGDDRFIQEINLSGAALSRRLICLSGADEFGFEETSRAPSLLLARTRSEWYASDGINPWSPVTDPRLRQVSLLSQRYRVFLETQFSGNYKNIPMVRNAYSTETVSLVSNHSTVRAFTFYRQMQIALCFDLYDDDTGLTQVLAALRRRGIKATFFLNGDFIRRNPLSASFIAASGHETASLFYAPIDFSDSRYRVTRDFIVQGLARNEDEFHRATGRELSMLWHPPFYRTSNLINTAAAASGYLTVERTIDPGDWLSREEAIRLSLRQISPSQMIEQIIEKKVPGAIVPVRLGLLGGGRDEYLFQRIEVLLDALIRSGCEIVPVSAAFVEQAAAARLTAPVSVVSAVGAAPVISTTSAAMAEQTPSSQPHLSLLSPASGTVLPDIKQPIEFRWDTSEEVARSRLIISRNANPAMGRAEVEIQNPRRTVTVNQLGEGLWYWTVEAYTRDGRLISAGEPRQLRLQAIPLLPAPESLLPQKGYLIGAEQIRQQRNINFSWSAVEGTNSYILTIIMESSSGRQQIFQTDPLDMAKYTFNELRLLENDGEYLWQVEAIRLDSEGKIIQRGRPSESNFKLNVPHSRAQTGETGVLYGF